LRRFRLAILGDSPCDLCTAACCKQNGHAYAVLLEGDRERRRFAAFSIDLPIQQPDGAVRLERVLPYRDGRCGFLGDNDGCTIYDDRPANCRRFQCVGDYGTGRDGFGRHGPFLRANSGVLAVLEGFSAATPQLSL
jgi:Fe-S-cluster containining protein